jgi:CheY-like chemotaxis protein
MSLNSLPHGLMLCDDLIFFSRVAGAARAIGTAVRMERNSTDLLTALRKQTPGCIIVDLQNPGLNLAQLLQELHSTCPMKPFLVAYGSHVEAETLREARKAGCNRVLPRSQFVVELENDLADWLGVPKKTSENAGNQ